jgi:zinc/manganese transport system substrate-binding protein
MVTAALMASLALTVAMASPAGGQEPQPGARPSIVVTTEVLRWLVEELADGDADVRVLMHGVDPHTWEPSARDIETLSRIADALAP